MNIEQIEKDFSHFLKNSRGNIHWKMIGDLSYSMLRNFELEYGYGLWNIFNQSESEMVKAGAAEMGSKSYDLIKDIYVRSLFSEELGLNDK